MNRHYLALPALLGALLGATVAAHAQGVPTPQPAVSAPSAAGAPGTQPRKHRGNRMMRALRNVGLSSAQQTQVRAAMQSFRASRTSGTPETRAQLKANIENILTPAQRTQFEAATQRKARAGAQPENSPQPR